MKPWKLLPGLIASAALLTAAAWAAPATYKLDPAHSSVTFEIAHFGISKVPGRFEKLEGRFVHDPDNPAASTAEVTIDVASINTAVRQRDDHLRSADFFEVEKYPQMTFKSKRVTNATKDGFKLVGDLALHGVTKEVTLDVTFGGTHEQRGTMRAGFVATAQLDRTDFGVGANNGVTIGKKVDIRISVEGIQDKPEAAASAAAAAEKSAGETKPAESKTE